MENNNDNNDNNAKIVSIHDVSSQDKIVSSHLTLEHGDNLHGYDIVSCAGKGRFSKVWIGSNMWTKVAIKVFRVGEDNLEEFLNEIKIYSLLKHECEQRKLNNGYNNYISEYVESFVHIARDLAFNARLHPCIVFRAAAGTLSDYIKYCERTYDAAIPEYDVKNIMRQVLIGLATMHECGIIHTDIKPSNILLLTPMEEEIIIAISDLGGSIIDNASDNYGTIGTTHYNAPETIIEMPFGRPVDIWASFVMCFRMLTGEYLFDVYAEMGISYGEDADDQALGGLELITGIKIEESNENTNINDELNNELNNENNNEMLVEVGSKDDNSKSSKNKKEYHDRSEDSDSSDIEEDIDLEKINYRHLLLIAKVLGYPPDEFTSNARKYYNRNGRLKNNPDITPITLADLIANNYELDEQVCKDIEEFLLLGLKYMPEDRISAQDALNAKWLS